MLCLLSCPAQSCPDEEIHFYKPSTIGSESFVQTYWTGQDLYAKKSSRKNGDYSLKAQTPCQGMDGGECHGFAGFQAGSASHMKAIE
jgi:hypothetical protein